MRLALLVCCLAVFVSGCGTMHQMENSCVSEGFNHVYKDYTIDVTSDPPGARIDWDGEYVGTTPLKRVLNGRKGIAATTVVTAHAVSEGQCCQTKHFDADVALPNQIHFDLTKK